MVRTQIQLTEEQATALKRLSARKHESVAELIREGVEILLRSDSDVSPEELRQRAIKVAGSFRSGRSDLSTKHDKYFAESYKK